MSSRSRRSSSIGQATTQTNSRDVEKTGNAGQGAPQFASFWSPQMAAARKEYIIMMVRVTFLVTLLVFTAFALYWGSLFKQYKLTPKLAAWVINRDPTGVIGQNITQTMRDITNSKQLGHVSWYEHDPAAYTDAQIDYEVAVEQRPWAVLVIAENATARFEAARASGDATWNPSSLLTLVYSESRNQQTVPGIVVSGTNSALTPVLAKMSQTYATQYLNDNANNPAALAAIARAPQLLSNSITLGTKNLRPYLFNPYQGALLAASYVGLIYLTILSFNIVMANFNIRQGISRRLTLSSLIGMRIAVPVIIYFWLSLMFTLLQAAFQLDFNGWGRGWGAGFMVFWMVSWSSMTALGLTLECLISLVGPQFIAFGLVFVIITNVSGALIPLELIPGFYRYNYAMVYYNTRSIFVLLFTNAGKHIDILKHVGIIWVWVAVMLLTFPIWIWRERRAQLKQMAAGAKGQQTKDEHEHEHEGEADADAQHAHTPSPASHEHAETESQKERPASSQ
ncbi:unnamed protein product [Parajaminaea phylloscopi]